MLRGQGDKEGEEPQTVAQTHTDAPAVNWQALYLHLLFKKNK